MPRKNINVKMRNDTKKNEKKEEFVKKKEIQLNVSEMIRKIEESNRRTMAEELPKPKSRVQEMAASLEEKIRKNGSENDREKEYKRREKTVPGMKRVGQNSKENRLDTKSSTKGVSKVWENFCVGIPVGTKSDPRGRNGTQGDLFSSKSTRKGKELFVLGSGGKFLKLDTSTSRNTFGRGSEETSLE